MYSKFIEQNFENRDKDYLHIIDVQQVFHIMMGQKINILVRGNGERLKMKVDQHTTIRKILTYLQNQSKSLATLLKTNKYNVLSKTTIIKDLETTQVAHLKKYQFQGQFLAVINIESSLGNTQAKEKLFQSSLSEQKTIETLSKIEEGDIMSLRSMYEKNQISMKIYEKLSRIIQGREEAHKDNEQLSLIIHRSQPIVRKNSRLTVQQKRNATILEDSEKKNKPPSLLYSSKTFENFQNMEGQACRFLVGAIEKVTDRKIKRFSNIHYDMGIGTDKNYYPKMEGTEHFLVFLVYKKNIFGIYCHHAFQDYRDNMVRDKGFFFSINKEEVYFPKKDSCIWKYSRLALKIGQKFLSMVSITHNRRPALHQLGKFEDNFQTQGRKFSNIINSQQQHTIQLDSVQFLQVKFDETAE